MNRSLSFGFCVLSNSLYAFPLFSVQNFMLIFDFSLSTPIEDVVDIKSPTSLQNEYL